MGIGEGNGNPLQYFCLENPVDRGAWWAAAHRGRTVGHNWQQQPEVENLKFPGIFLPFSPQPTGPLPRNMLRVPSVPLLLDFTS